MCIGNEIEFIFYLKRSAIIIKAHSLAVAYLRVLSVQYRSGPYCQGVEDRCEQRRQVEGKALLFALHFVNYGRVSSCSCRFSLCSFNSVNTAQPTLRRNVPKCVLLTPQHQHYLNTTNYHTHFYTRRCTCQQSSRGTWVPSWPSATILSRTG